MARQPSDLKRHTKGHEGIPYPCAQCNFIATKLVNLKQHLKTNHEGIKYPCDALTNVESQAA